MKKGQTEKNIKKLKKLEEENKKLRQEIARLTKTIKELKNIIKQLKQLIKILQKEKKAKNVYNVEIIDIDTGEKKKILSTNPEQDIKSTIEFYGIRKVKYKIYDNKKRLVGEGEL